jgi:hypothetical protein
VRKSSHRPCSFAAWAAVENRMVPFSGLVQFQRISEKVIGRVAVCFGILQAGGSIGQPPVRISRPSPSLPLGCCRHSGSSPRRCPYQQRGSQRQGRARRCGWCSTVPQSGSRCRGRWEGRWCGSLGCFVVCFGILQGDGGTRQVPP